MISMLIIHRKERKVNGRLHRKEGNLFELIAEECYYDDKWREENGID